MLRLCVDIPACLIFFSIIYTVNVDFIVLILFLFGWGTSFCLFRLFYGQNARWTLCLFGRWLNSWNRVCLKLTFSLSFSLWSLASANHRTHRHSHHKKFNSDDRNYTRISIFHTDTVKCSKLRRFRWIFHFSSIPSEHKPMLINVYSAQASVMNKFAEHFLLHIHTNTTHTTSTLCDDEWRK